MPISEYSGTGYGTWYANNMHLQWTPDIQKGEQVNLKCVNYSNRCQLILDIGQIISLMTWIELFQVQEKGAFLKIVRRQLIP